MDEKVEAALKTYSVYLDGQPAKLDKTTIDAIRILREYVYLLDPGDEDIQHTLVTAKMKKMSGATLEALVRQYPPPRNPFG